MKTLKLIRTERDYRAALRDLGAFFDRNPDTAAQDEQDYYEVLAQLVHSYETKHHAVLPPAPIEAIRFRMEQQGLDVKDMADTIGQPNRVYEILNGKRPLSLAMIRRLHDKLGIPADVLIQA